MNQCKNLSLSAWFRKRTPLEAYAQTLHYKTPEEIDLFFAVMALPQKYRAVIHLYYYLYYYENFSTREMGEILHLKEATGGETCNPVTAIRVCINSEDCGASLEQNKDGSYIIHMKPGDQTEIHTGDGASLIQVEGYEEGIFTDVRIDPNTGSSSVILSDDTENT